jgi:hypothetical protein
VIVRILGEGQLSVPKDALEDLNKLDDVLQDTVHAGDEGAFREAMNALLARIREVGAPLDASDLKPSDFILPSADASLDEVRDLLSSDGLIPG